MARNSIWASGFEWHWQYTHYRGVVILVLYPVVRASVFVGFGMVYTLILLRALDVIVDQGWTGLGF